jgi:hypothetical protein
MSFLVKSSKEWTWLKRLRRLELRADGQKTKSALLHPEQYSETVLAIQTHPLWTFSIVMNHYLLSQTMLSARRKDSVWGKCYELETEPNLRAYEASFQYAHPKWRLLYIKLSSIPADLDHTWRYKYRTDFVCKVEKIPQISAQ